MFLLKNKAPKEIVTTRFEIRIKPWSKIIQMLTVDCCVRDLHALQTVFCPDSCHIYLPFQYDYSVTVTNFSLFAMIFSSFYRTACHFR